MISVIGLLFSPLPKLGQLSQLGQLPDRMELLYIYLPYCLQKVR